MGSSPTFDIKLFFNSSLKDKKMNIFYFCNKNIVGWEDFSNDSQLILINPKFGYRLTANLDDDLIKVTVDLIRSFRQNLSEEEHFIQLKDSIENILFSFFSKCSIKNLKFTNNYIDCVLKGLS